MYVPRLRPVLRTRKVVRLTVHIEKIFRGKLYDWTAASQKATGLGQARLCNFSLHLHANSGPTTSKQLLSP